MENLKITKYVRKTEINALSGEHMDNYLSEKTMERIVLGVMEETGELSQIISKLRRNELAGKEPDGLKLENLAEELAHVWMVLQYIKYWYGITEEDINKQIEKTLIRYYEGRENP